MSRLLKVLGVAALAWLLLDFVLAASFTAQQVQHHDDGASKQQPYGGCDEAYLYPNTPGYRWCERNGYLD